MSSITYRLWKKLHKKNTASPFFVKLFDRLSERLLKRGEIDAYYPLLSDKPYKIAESFAVNSYKKYFALQLFENVMETLVVGSSHGFCGYWAEERLHEINACEPSQDLYYSYEIYKKYADAPRLKNVVLFYSVFSPGSVLELTSQADGCDCYRYFYGIPYRFGGNTEKRGAREAFSLFVERMKKKPDFHYVENVTKPPVFDTDPRERAASHLKNNKRDENQTVYVAKAAALAKEKGHRLYVVVPPARSDYTACLPPFEEIFAELLKLKDGVRILSFFGDSRFSDSDFCDTDHLTADGAKKLSALIREQTG